MNDQDIVKLKAHVADLEQQLHVTKTILSRAEQTQNGQNVQTSLPLGPELHNLLLLSDSALPLGSFAYSSGLESFLAHHKAAAASHSTDSNYGNIKQARSAYTLFQQFIKLSIESMAFTQIPYVLAAFRDPSRVSELDNDLDASTPCTVQRRASVAQGRALLSVFEKAYIRPSRIFEHAAESTAAIKAFSAELKLSTLSHDLIKVNGHLAPLWGAVTLTLGLKIEDAAYIFLLNHAKAVISAGVRASVMGPYQAQALLASQDLQKTVKIALEKGWLVDPEDAGQSVPSMDLWNGRHELLYSRIFNS